MTNDPLRRSEEIEEIEEIGETPKQNPYQGEIEETPYQKPPAKTPQAKTLRRCYRLQVWCDV